MEQPAPLLSPREEISATTPYEVLVFSRGVLDCVQIVLAAMSEMNVDMTTFRGKFEEMAIALTARGGRNRGVPAELMAQSCYELQRIRAEEKAAGQTQG